MIDDPKDPFADLDDSDFLSEALDKGPAPVVRPPVDRAPGWFEPAQLDRGSIFTHECEKCGGSGFWKGNRRFPCFVCKGKGTRSFKTSPEARAKARAKGAQKAVQREIDKAAWREANAPAIAWARRAAQRNAERGGTFDFPAKLVEALDKYGSWTDGQLAAVEKLMARDAARKAESIAKRSTTIDASRIEAAFAKARESAARPGMRGIWTKPLSLRAAEMDFTFQPGSTGSQWEGMIFVRSGERKLGAIKGGVFTRRFECNDAEAIAIQRACEDPAQAAIAYGKAWSICSVCHATLMNDESIARGIGPICAGKFGF